MKQSKTQLNPRSLARSSVVSATSSIELFNRPRAEDRISLSLIANIRAWEQLGKATLLKKGENIQLTEDKTFSASKVIRLLDSKYNLISPGEAQTVQQIISLRDEATHSDLNFVPDDLAAHLLYFSLKSFKILLLRTFSSYARNLNANFISINFQPTYTYGARIQRMLGAKTLLAENRLLFLLERGLHNAQTETELTKKEWVQKIRSLRNRRITKTTLLLKKYATEHNNVLFITVEAPSKYGKADVTLSRGKHGAKTKIAVVSSDPEETHPYLTNELATKLGIGKGIAQRAIKELGLKGNKDYHLSIRSGKNSVVQRYNETALNQIKEHLKQ
ncbi:MAG: hypothetical protein Q8P01_04480 [bacterium]|nr:hypothetical protein [bacterium]